MKTTILYNPFIDDGDFDDLIDRGFVLDDNGKVTINPPDPQTLKFRSVLSIDQVISGRGCFDAWKSNMQKMIRRGKFNQALQSFIECANCGGPFLSNIVNRLCRTISVEDIGIANIKVIHEATLVLDHYEKYKKDGLTNTLLEKASNLIKLMCASPKSRTSDVLYHYLKVHNKYKLNNESLEQLFVKFVLRLRKKNYEEACFYAGHACELNKALGRIPGYKKCSIFGRKKKVIYDVFSALLQSEYTNKVVKGVIMDLVKLFELKEGTDWMLLVNCGILCVCFSDKLSTEVPLRDIDEKDDREVWIDDTSYDKHTSIGRSLGRGVKYFWEFGCKLSHLSNVDEIAKLDEDLYRQMLESAQGNC